MSADLALINANIQTMNPRQPTAEATAVTKNKIIKVGTNKEIQQLIDKYTIVINLKGKTVVPGLIDTHIHVADFGRCLMWLSLNSAHSIPELQRLIEEKAAKTPKGKWIIGQGWNETHFKEQSMPTIADLDQAAPDHPVILYREAAMICAVNSKALKAAEVTEQTVVPQGGVIKKNPETGRLTGVFYDTATSLIWQFVPEPTQDELLDATANACQKIIQEGITSVVWLVISESELPIIQKLHAQDRLPFRVNVVVPEALINKTAMLQDHRCLRVGGAFIVVDGYLDSKEAALQKPYSDEPSNSGKMYLTKETLEASVAKVLAAGVQPVIHAMGDKAIDTTLKVMEENPNGNMRFRIEQAAVLNNDLIGRLKNLNVVVTVQPKVISTEFKVWSAKQRLGERAKLLHPLKTLLKEGVKVAGGSDCPMEPLSPLLDIQEVVMRESAVEQRLSVEEALQIYTINAAYASGEEADKGSIEEGKLADFTVLSDNPLVVQPNRIKDISSEMTIVDGKIVYSTSCYSKV